VLFLDEVSEMSLSAQAKFLRFVQEREFQRLGGKRTQKANVRVIAASNRDLRQAVEQGKFREDLFYRLNVIPVRLPSLRERKEDIPLLVQHFVEKFSAASTPARGAVTVSQEAMRRLMAYGWPGNVRQLENAIERTFALSAGRPQVDVGDLPPEVQAAHEPPITSSIQFPEDGIDLDRFVASIERELIDRSLQRTGGNKGRAAKLLNMKRTTLVERLKRLDRDRV
jgi:two-component system response regulator AtoC